MKVLIVEDEYVSRRKLEKILSPYFICQSATTANDALNLYLTSIQKRSPFKLIFLDIVLPDESGVELLQKIRNKETELGIDENKRSKIIMTTSKSDINTVKTCIQFGCNDYIVKPFDKKKVLEKIKHYIPTNNKSISREKENIIDYVIKRLKKGELFTIGFSNVWLAVKDAISKDIHISTVAEIIKQDPVVTYKIIQISNSPIYRPVKKITSLEDALSRIGLEESLNIIHNVFMKNMIFSQENIFDDFLERYFKHSVAVANLCEIICKQLSLKTDEDPYLLGLFHDIGKLVFITAVDEVIKQKDIKGELTIQDI